MTPTKMTVKIEGNLEDVKDQVKELAKTLGIKFEDPTVKHATPSQVSYIFHALGMRATPDCNPVNKIQAIKATREVFNLGLKEAKDVVEGTFV